MRKIKKIAAVAITAAMTMAMGISAFAGEVTFHFKNVKGWDTVGSWIYEGKAFDINVTPADKCAVVNGEKQLWPGAKCEDEGNGWVKITATFTGEKPDAVLKFNNWVADNTINDTTTQEDLDKLAASGIVCDSSKKEETPAIMLGVPKDGWIGFDASEYWIEWDGASTAPMGQEGVGVYKEAPASYTAPGADEPATDAPVEDETDAPAEDKTDAPEEDKTDAPAEDATDAPAEDATDAPADDKTDADDNGNANVGDANDNKTETETTTASKGETAPQTGDAAAMAVVLFGFAAAAAYVVSKKVNA
jgi:hypothetical protein